jgi:polysaccharide biosynthesis/export protein
MVSRRSEALSIVSARAPALAWYALAALLMLPGCAKQSEPMHGSALIPPAAAVGQPAPQNPTAHADDAPLSGDPMTDRPPMPVALVPPRAGLATVAAVTPLPATGAAFRGSIGAEALGSQPVAFLARSKPDWTPVTTITTVDHLPPDTIAVSDEPEPYLLDAGDRVRVFVYGQPNLSRAYPIDASGTIAMPLIGAVTARGLTIQKLKGRIAAALAVRYVRDPEVAVEISQYRPFFILGEVRNAGQYAWVNDLTVQTAVAIAGGFSPRATERSVRLTRRVDGVISEIDVPTSYTVKPGDTVYVQERFF